MLEPLDLIRNCSYSHLVHGLILDKAGQPYTKNELRNIHRDLKQGVCTLECFYHLNEELGVKQLYRYHRRLKQFYIYGTAQAVSLLSLHSINRVYLDRSKIPHIRQLRNPRVHGTSTTTTLVMTSDSL